MLLVLAIAFSSFAACDVVADSTANAGGDNVEWSCGDGLMNAAAGESCSNVGESPTCTADCTASLCGDGVLNAAADEECDDGNVLPGDGCDESCGSEAIEMDFRLFVENYSYTQSGSEEYLAPTTSELTEFADVLDDFLAGDYAQAHAMAEPLGYEVVLVVDTESSFEIRCLMPIFGHEQGRGLFCLNPDSLHPHHIVAPHPVKDASTGVVAVDIFRGGGYRYYSVSTASRCASEAYSGCSGSTSVGGHSEPFRVSDAAHNDDTFFQLYTERVHDIGSSTVTIQIHGCGSSSCPSGTQNDVVARFSVGSELPFGPSAISNELNAEFGRILPDLRQGAVTRSCNLEGEPDYRLCATTNTQGRYVNGNTEATCTSSATATTESRFLHIEANFDLRHDSGGDDTLTPKVLVDALNAVL